MSQLLIRFVIIVIIESVDSIRRDGPDILIQYKMAKNFSIDTVSHFLSHIKVIFG